MTLKTNNIRVLIADDDKDYVEIFKPFVTKEGIEVLTAHTPEDVTKKFTKYAPQIVFLDYDFDGKRAGINLLKKIKNKAPETVVIMVTAKGTKNIAMDAMRWGSFNYLKKDDDPELNEKKINRAIELFLNKEMLREKKIKYNMVGFDDVEIIQDMINKFSKIENAAIFITGESGTGKQLVAKNIHLSSPNYDSPFITFNCCAVSDNLIETMLFGYKKDAFAGATNDTKGALEKADGGTIFLDEIGSASLNFQLKLLNILETGEYFSVGDFQPKKLEARVVLATNENIEKLITEGKFRKDLYYRISKMHIKLSPLNEQKKDIPLLIGHYLNKLNKKYNQQKPASPSIIKVCEDISWGGNVRELFGTLERCYLLTDNDESITSDHFYKYYSPVKFNKNVKSHGNTLKEKVENYEKKLLQEVLSKTKTQKQAAKQLGLLEATLSEKLKKYNMGGYANKKALLENLKNPTR